MSTSLSVDEVMARAEARRILRDAALRVAPELAFAPVSAPFDPSKSEARHKAVRQRKLARLATATATSTPGLLQQRQREAKEVDVKRHMAAVAEQQAKLTRERLEAQRARADLNLERRHRREEERQAKEREEQCQRQRREREREQRKRTVVTRAALVRQMDEAARLEQAARQQHLRRVLAAWRGYTQYRLTVMVRAMARARWQRLEHFWRRWRACFNYKRRARKFEVTIRTTTREEADATQMQMGRMHLLRRAMRRWSSWVAHERRERERVEEHRVGVSEKMAQLLERRKQLMQAKRVEEESTAQKEKKDETTKRSESNAARVQSQRSAGVATMDGRAEEIRRKRKEREERQKERARMEAERKEQEEREKEEREQLESVWEKEEAERVRERRRGELTRADEMWKRKVCVSVMEQWKRGKEKRERMRLNCWLSVWRKRTQQTQRMCQLKREQTLLKECFLRWKVRMESEEERTRNAQETMKRKIVRRMVCAWKSLVDTRERNWTLWVARTNSVECAENFHSRLILGHFFRAWMRRYPLERDNRLRNVRKEKLRDRVRSLLPDFGM